MKQRERRRRTRGSESSAPQDLTDRLLDLRNKAEWGKLTLAKLQSPTASVEGVPRDTPIGTPEDAAAGPAPSTDDDERPSP